jgi:hypothetical protein
VILLAAAALLCSVWCIFVGFHHSIFDFHGFRQAQTAISAEYMEHGGAFLRYQTPVLGPPWSIPFEFPLYQKIVALIAEHFHAPLDEAGRAVSIGFFYLCFLPLASILKRLRYTPVQILAILSLFAVSPLYIFVSRLFMIESTALFFSLMYVDMIFKLAIGDKPWQNQHMFLAALFGSLAGLVKVTTFAPFFLLGSAVGLWQLWQQHRNRALPLSRITAVVLLCGLLPLSLTLWWTRFAGAVREQNPICVFFLGRGLDLSWNFGTLAERMHPANYMHFIHAVPGQAGSLPLLLLLVLIYAVVVRRWNVAALCSLALYVFTSMLFFNLHLIHAYYPYSCAIFLVVAAGLLIVDLLSLPGRRAWLGFAFLAALILICLDRYHEDFYRIQQWDAPGRTAAAAIIDRTTNAGDVILITGLGWSSELPYQSHRRSIMDFPGAFANYPHPLTPLITAIRNLGAQTIPEVVVCDDSRGTGRARALLNLVDIPDSTTLHADNCDVYLRAAQ